MAPWNRDVLAEVHEDCVTGWNDVEAKIFRHDSLKRCFWGPFSEYQFLGQNSPIVYFPNSFRMVLQNEADWK